MADQTTTERFIADTSAYVRRVEEAARQADAFGRSNSETALAARRMGLAASEAADRAGRAMRDAADAAQRLAREEIGVDEASKAAAKAARELERADIAQATAARAAARATNDLADQQRKAAEAAVVAAGLERLASLRAQGSIREHNTLLTHLRRNYNGVGADVREMSSLASRAFGVVTRAVSNAGDGLTSLASGLAQSWPALLAMVAAGIVALPVVAIAAGGAITLAVGGALAGIGILAVAKSAEVKAAFSEFAASAKAQAQEWAAPWKPAIQGILRQADAMMHQLGPIMTGVFAKMAPAVEKFVGQLGQGILAMAPSFTVIGDGFNKVLAQLGPAMTQALSDVGVGLEEIAKAAGDHAYEFGQLIIILGEFVNGLGTMIGWLIRAGSAVQRFFGILDFAAGKPQAVAVGLDAMGAASGRNSVQTQLMGGALNVAATSMELASLSAADLKTKLDSLAGKELSARDAAAAYATSIFAVNKALHDNGTAHGFATVKGVANEQALTALAKAANANSVAMSADGRSAQDVSKFMEEARARIVATAIKMGYGRGEAEALAIKLTAVSIAANKIPPNKSVTVQQHGFGDAIAASKNLRSSIDQLHDKSVTVTYYVQGNGIAATKKDGGYIGQGYAAGGMARHYATAGMVSGPGTGTSDSIDAKLSNGEYVVKATATAANRAALDAANYFGAELVAYSHGTSSNPDPRPRLTAPTPVMPEHHGLQSYGNQRGREQVVNNHIYINGSVVTENELTSMLQTKILQQGKSLTLPAGR